MFIQEIQQQLIETIKQHVQPNFLLLFGTFAKGTVHDESEIDFAYFNKQQVSSYERFILAGDLASIAHREVDLKQIDTVFTMQIFEQGIPIYINNENEFMRQKMRAYSMYAACTHH